MKKVALLFAAMLFSVVGSGLFAVSVVDGFDPNANGGVNSIAVQSDGKILVGGLFSSIGGQTRNRIARLSMDDAALQELSITSDDTTLNWTRSQSSPEVYDVTFWESSDMSNWASLGQATRISCGLQMTGLSLPFYQNRYVRAQGKAYEEFANATTSLIESVRQYYNPSYALTVAKSGTYSGMAKGTSITMHGTPDEGSTFTG